MDEPLAASTTTKPEPFLGMWGWLVLVGLGLVALAQLISVLSHMNDLPDEDVAPVLFNILGALCVGFGLALAGLFLRTPSAGIRAALIIAGCYLMVMNNTASLVNFLLRF